MPFSLILSFWSLLFAALVEAMIIFDSHLFTPDSRILSSLHYLNLEHHLRISILFTWDKQASFRGTAATGFHLPCQQTLGKAENTIPEEQLFALH